MKIRLICSVLLTTLSVWAGEKEAIEALKKGDYQTAYNGFVPLAEDGDSKAMVSIGWLYHEGRGFKQDYDKAMDWYLKAFQKRNGDACNNIGVMYRDGLGVSTNLQIAYALFWITHWEALGSESTQYRVGRNIEKIVARMAPEQIEEAVKMTAEYVVAYVEKRGNLTDREKALKFSREGHAIKEMANLKSDGVELKCYEFTYELRVPTNVFVEPLTKISVVTEQHMSGTNARLTKQRREGIHLVLQGSTLLYAEKRRAVVVQPEKQSAQVFTLVLPTELTPADWSNWRKPDYVELSDAHWTFMHDIKDAKRSTNVPPGSFEMRYKIEKSQY
jgi:hypothetical protein